MKVNKWTFGLAAAGLVSLPVGSQADEKLNPMLTAVTPTTVSGYINTSIHWTPGTGNRVVPNHGQNTPNKQDGFNLNVVDLALEKPLDEAQWAAGYKAELLFGQDANIYATQSPTAVGPADFGIKQAYLALRAPVGNGLDFKVGVWDTITGYEVFNAGSNPNYTRSYSWTIEPTTFTGVLATYQLCKFASASAGIANTYGPAINGRANVPGAKAESYKTYLAGLFLTAPDDWGFLGGSAFYATFHNGYNSGFAGGADQTSYFVGATVNTPLKWLKVGACYDYLGTTSDFGDSSYANAYTLYSSIQIPDSKFSLHLRGEYANSDTAVLGSGANLPGGNSEVFATTATLQYDLWQNVLSRLEFRWDHQAGDNDMTGYGGDLAKPASTNGKRNSYLLALNLIYKF
ncbi:MAG TPA: outer membrane beta-barrel protein [Verrucomicrobiae bacterium]|nr:outer membrane beta-barrel protein [Verrucomicrobiae bacterium]